MGVLEFVAPTSLGLPARNATDSSWKLGSSSNFCTANCLLKKEKHFSIYIEREKDLKIWTALADCNYTICNILFKVKIKVYLEI